MNKTAFLFTGQSSQYVGMGKSLYESAEVCRTCFDRADDIMGRNISAICFEGPDERLNMTENTQPCILTTEYAAFAALSARGARPDAIAGFSLGEYGALAAAGVLSFEDALGIIKIRAKAMQEAVPVGKGAMGAVMGPAERAIAAAQLPGVATPVLDGAENYIKMLDHGGDFETTILSGDDLKKTAQYHARAQAAQAQAAFADYGQYLDSLEMTATIRPFEAVYMQRIAQLTNKSNQFNLTTLRCTEDDIRSMAEKPDWITLYGKLVDKFADNGVVTVVAGQAQGQTLCLRLWLMSCRVLKRGMEDAMMDTLAAKAAAAGYTALEGYYYPTAKNAMVREFYAGYGFEKTAEDADGNTTWRLDLAAYNPRCPHIKIET